MNFHPKSHQFLTKDSISVSKAISDVIREIYISNDIKFDLIIYGETSNHINDVIDEVIKEINGEVPTILKNIKNVDDWDHLIYDSAIIFIKFASTVFNLHLKSFEIDHQTSRLTSITSKQFKFLVYVEEIKNIQDLDKSIRELNYMLHIQVPDIRYYEFFITADEKLVNLTAFKLFTENHCEKFELKILNSFNLTLQKWNQKLENFEHFNNFYGCMINFLFSYSEAFYFKDIGQHKLTNEVKAKIDHELYSEDCKFSGLLHEIVLILSKTYNFTYHYTFFLASTDTNNNTLFYKNNYQISPWNLYKFYFELTNRSYNAHYSLPFADAEYYYLVSYNDLYNNCEKLFFPFDTETWLLLLFTFGLTSITIFGLQFTSHHIRTIIYGKEVENPGFNALSIFFGISQIRLPTEFFCRLIWLLFIWFCLIIRTCWQSKMFEFMTTDMRKPLPASIGNLKEMNYTIVLTNYYLHQNLNNEYMQGREAPIIKNLLFKEFFDLYEEVLDGKTATKYAFFVGISDHKVLNSTFERTLPKMENENIKKDKTFGLMKNSMLTHHIDYVMDRLIPTGVMKFLDDYGFWYIHRKLEVQPEDSRKILSMSDLEFGFVIFLAALSFSIIVFICELHALFVRKQLRKLLGLYELLRVVRERLKDYHDRW